MKLHTRIISGTLAAIFGLFTLCACRTNAPSDDTTASEQEQPAELTEINNAGATRSWYYQNPLVGSAADPMIVEHEGTFYLYSTGNKTLSVRTSKNLTTWSEPKQIFSLSQTSWGAEKCWAPEVHKYNGKFYLFFCGKTAGGDRGIFHGSVAVCDTPDGTFVPVTKEPLLNFNYSVIDLSFFADDDGRTYIFYSKDNSTNYIGSKRVSQSYGVEVSNDFTRLIGEPVLCSTPTQSWETQSGNVIWNEGPVVFKKNGTYYLLFSANYYQSANYAVGYCTSDKPLALYEKPKDSSILKGNGEDITGSGHCNLLFFEDEIYLTYHSHTVPPNTDGGRSLYIDKLVIKEDGTLHANGPTNTRQPMPEGQSGVHKFDGKIELSASLTDADQELDCLVDEVNAKGLVDIVEFADGDSVTFKFEEAQELDAMWIYSTKMYGYMPGEVDIIINNQYIMRGVGFSSVRGSAAIATFKNLPEGEKISEIKLTFRKAEGSEVSAIGEVTFISINK